MMERGEEPRALLMSRLIAAGKKKKKKRRNNRSIRGALIAARKTLTMNVAHGNFNGENRARTILLLLSAIAQ